MSRARCLNAGERAQRFAGSAHPYIVPAQVFATRDGWLSLFVTHDDFWRRLCDEIGQPEWITDARFATMAARTANRALVVGSVAQIIAERDAAEWLRRLVPLGIVAAAVTSLEEALASEQVRARRMVIEVALGDGMIRTVGNPIKTGSAGQHRPPPLLGEHNHLLANGVTA